MIIRTLLKICAVLLSTFVVLELYYQVTFRAASTLPSFLRVYDFRYFDSLGTPRFPPNLDAWHKSYGDRPDTKIHINSQGFRGDEPLSAPSKRIAMLGDSIVFNGGVNLEESFSRLDEAQLRLSEKDPKIEVLNFGVGDINLYQTYLKYKNHVAEFHPALSIIHVYLNDSVDSLSTQFDSSARTTHLPWYHSFASEQLQKLWRNFHLLWEARTSVRYEWVDDFQIGNYRHDEASWIKMIERARFDWGAAWRPESWKIIETWMRAILTESKANRSEVKFVILPARPQLEMPSSTSQIFVPQQYAAEIASHLGIEMLDPLPYFRSLDGRENFYYDQCHFTVEGNRAMMQFLLPYFQEWIRGTSTRN